MTWRRAILGVLLLSAGASVGWLLGGKPSPAGVAFAPPPKPAALARHEPEAGREAPGIREAAPRAPARRVAAALALPLRPPRPAPETVGLVAVVIDDLGLLKTATERAIALDPAVTLAFLPYGGKSSGYAERAHAAGHEVLLHMPMQPDGRLDPGPGALLVNQSTAEIRARLAEAFAQVPLAIGLNNHMGSRFTADPRAMAVVLGEVMAQHMMVLDSRTTAKTVIGDLAGALGVPFAERDVFIDNDRDPALIAGQLEKIERIARTHGVATAIGHPYSETVDALAEWLPTLRARGLEPVPISRLARPGVAHPMTSAERPEDESAKATLTR